jgi:hypothetical protein
MKPDSGGTPTMPSAAMVNTAMVMGILRAAPAMSDTRRIPAWLASRPAQKNSAPFRKA